MSETIDGRCCPAGRAVTTWTTEGAEPQGHLLWDTLAHKGSWQKDEPGSNQVKLPVPGTVGVRDPKEAVRPGCESPALALRPGPELEFDSLPGQLFLGGDMDVMI